MLEEPPVLRGMRMPEFALFFQSWILPTICVTLGLGTTRHTPAPLKRELEQSTLSMPWKGYAHDRGREPANENSLSD